MNGTNKLILNKETIIEALQYYLNANIFTDPVEITDISYELVYDAVSTFNIHVFMIDAEYGTEIENNKDKDAKSQRATDSSN
jgi:hypothetical protein